MMRLSKTDVTIILAGVYIFLQMTADIAAAKVVMFGNIVLPFLGPLVMDAGIIYAVTFTWRDLVHKQLGKRAAQVAIILAAAINVLMALYFQLVIMLPAEPEWSAAGGQAAFTFIFGLVPRIVIASIIAEIFSELVDTEAYQKWVDRFGKRAQWARVVVSNAISIPLDSLIFVSVAFLGEPWFTFTVFSSMFLWNIIVKGVVTALTFWTIYLIPDKPLYST